jgi:hypothetical protein
MGSSLAIFQNADSRLHIDEPSLDGRERHCILEFAAKADKYSPGDASLAQW